MKEADQKWRKQYNLVTGSILSGVSQQARESDSAFYASTPSPHHFIFDFIQFNHKKYHYSKKLSLQFVIQKKVLLL